MKIDTTKPNAARIYDLMLEGTHNYPVDRAAAKQLLQMFPEFPQIARLFRYFLHRVAKRLAEEEFTCYLDLATGIPTEGYLHELVPETARIIYNDIEAETVNYAREILGDRPNILCVQSDLRDIDTILLQAGQFFGPVRKVGLFMVNVSYLIDDDSLRKVFQRLYNWCEPGSMLAISGAQPTDDETERSAQVRRFYDSIGTTIYQRTPQELLRLAEPWRVAVEMRNVEDYAEQSLGGSLVPNERIRGEFGYGGVLVR